MKTTDYKSLNFDEKINLHLPYFLLRKPAFLEMVNFYR